MTNYTRQFGLLVLILACTMSAAHAQAEPPPLRYAGDFARKYAVRTVPTVIVVDARGKPLADAIVGLTLPDFYNLYLEQAIDAARLQLRAR